MPFPVQINSSSIPSRRATNNSAGGYPPALSDETRASIMNSLLAHNGIQPIRATLEQQLASAGWMDALRHNISTLIQSGECTSYEEVMEQILASLNPGGGAAVAEGEDDEDDETNDRDIKKVAPPGLGSGPTAKLSADTQAQMEPLKVPEKVVNETVQVIKRELEKVCEVVLDN